MSEPEKPKARTDAVDAYLRSVRGPDEEGAAETLRTPVIATGARPGEEVGVVDRETLTKKIDSVRSLKGFERLTLLRTLFDERMRLAQSVRGRPTEEKQFFELRIVAKRGHLALAKHNEQRLRQFQSVEELMRRTGIDVPMAAELKQNMDVHLTESARAMDGLVALGNYIMLMYKLKDGKPVAREDLDEALARLPRTVEGRTGRTGEATKPIHLTLDPDALSGRSWREVLADQRYNDCQTALDLQLEWLLSFQKGVPGVSLDHEGENPVDVFCVDYLNRAVQATLDEEIRVGLTLSKGAERDAQVKNIRDVRTRLFQERETFKHLSGETIIQFLEDTNTGIFNKKFGAETTVEPASGLEFARMMSKLPEERAVVDQFFEQSAETFDAHRALVEQVFSFSLLNMKDWKYYVEDVHKKHFLSKVYPLLDTMVRVRAAPKVLASKAAGEALRKFEKGTGIPSSSIAPVVETTFKEEADKVMKEIQEGWHLPKTVVIDGREVPFDFHDDAHWAAIRPEQWEDIQKSQESTLSICLQQRGDIIDKINQCQKGAALLRSLRAIAHPLDLLEVDPDEEVFRGLMERRMDPEALLADPQLKTKKPVIVALYFFTIAQMDRDWDEYLVVSGRTDAKLKEVAERSLDEGRGYKDAKDLVPVPWWLVVWYASAMARAKWKAPWKPPFFRAPWRMMRDIPWAGRTALSPTGWTTRPPVRDLVDWLKKGKETPPAPPEGAVPPERTPPKRPAGPAAPKPPPEAPAVPPKAPKAPSVEPVPPRPVAPAAEPPAGATLPAAAETKGAETAINRGQSRFLGHAGYLLIEVATVSEILQSLERTANAEQMNERETLDAVRELWRDADHGMDLERGGDQFWMAGYNRKYYESLMVVTATGRREWVTQEREIIRQLQLSLDLILLLQSGSVPTDVPALPARTERSWPDEFWKKMEAERETLVKQGAALSERHQSILKRVKDFHERRSAQFPVYQAGKELTEQPFTRDRASGKINVNTSGTALGFIPVKFKNGPIMQFRKAGLDQREADEFSFEGAVKEMEELRKTIETFQSELKAYEERGWQFERALHFGPNAPEEKKPTLGDWMKSLQ